MAIRPADVIGLIWSHPVFSVVVLLLFTPPLFPIVVFFSPLLISTALVVLAMISMGSNSEEPPSYSGDAPYKRGWIEEDTDDGPVLLEGERATKRLRGVSKDENWFDKVKNWEGTGRAWVESVLSQEARRNDDSANARDSAAPLLSAAKVLFTEKPPPPPDVRTSTRQFNKDDAPASSDVPVSDIAGKLEFLNVNRRSKVEKSSSCSEITGPELDSEDELIEIAPSPLFRRLSLPKSDATDKIVGEEVESHDSRTKDLNHSEDSSDSTKSADSESGKVEDDEITSRDDAGTSSAKQVHFEGGNDVVEEKLPNVVTDSASKLSEGAAAIIGALEHVKPDSTSREINIEPKNVSINCSLDGIAANAQGSSAGNLRSPPPRQLKSAAEVLGTMRQSKESSHGRTPSVAVALSEKLKVPLEDIMSLYNGEDADNVPIIEPPVKVSSSSETTTSQEEEWSSSDEETSAPPKAAEPPSGEKDY